VGGVDFGSVVKFAPIHPIRRRQKWELRRLALIAGTLSDFGIPLLNEFVREIDYVINFPS
jgi:hypothetical protein